MLPLSSHRVAVVMSKREGFDEYRGRGEWVGLRQGEESSEMLKHLFNTMLVGVVICTHGLLN